MLYADVLCKQFGPNQAWFGSKLVDTLVTLEEYFEEGYVISAATK